MNKNLQKWLPIFLLAVTVLVGAWIIYTMSNKKKSVVKSPVQNKGPSDPSGLSITGGLKESYRMKFTTLDDMKDVVLNISWEAPLFLGAGVSKLSKYNVIVKSDTGAGATTDETIIDMTVDTTGNIEFNGPPVHSTTDGVSVSSSPRGFDSASYGMNAGYSPNTITFKFKHPYWENVGKTLQYGAYKVELKYIDFFEATAKDFSQPSQSSFNTDDSGNIAQVAPTAEAVQIDPDNIINPSYSIELIYPPEKRFVLKPHLETSYFASFVYDPWNENEFLPKIKFHPADDTQYAHPFINGGEKLSFDIVILSVDGYNNIYRLGFFVEDAGGQNKLYHFNSQTGSSFHITETPGNLIFKFFESVKGISGEVTIAFEQIDATDGDALDAFDISELDYNSRVIVYDSITDQLGARSVVYSVGYTPSYEPSFLLKPVTEFSS